MQTWKKKLVHTVIQLDDIFDKQVYRLRLRLGNTIHVFPSEG